jgi:hypothetical protein
MRRCSPLGFLASGRREAGLRTAGVVAGQGVESE